MSDVLCGLCSQESEHLQECRLCERTVCMNCSRREAELTHTTTLATLCQDCGHVLNSIDDLLSSKEILWAKQTPRGTHWMQACELSNYKTALGNNIDVYLAMPLSSDDEELIGKDVLSGRTDPEVLNWHLREALKGIRLETYRETLERVLKAYCAKNSAIGYCQGLNYIAMWMLLFLDENNTFWLLSFMVERLLLPDFYIGSKGGNSLNGFYIESSVISGFLAHYIPDISACNMDPEEFSSNFSLQLLIQLFVDKVPLSACMFLWDKLMEEGSIALIRGTVSLILMNKEAVQAGKHPLRILSSLMVTCDTNQLREAYAEVSKEVTERRVSQLRDQARNHRAKQWQTNARAVVSRLQKHSQFSKEEIEALQVQFNKYLESRNGCESNLLFQNRVSIRLPNESAQPQEGEVDIGISKTDFLQLIAKVNSSMSHSASLVFDQFDDDRSGYLDFRELLMCLSILAKGSFEDKLRLCFNAYDLDKSGYLQANEVEVLLDALLKPYMHEFETNYNPELRADMEQIRNSLMSLVHAENDVLSFPNFYSSVMASPILYACFERHIEAKSLTASALGRAMESEHSEKNDSCGCLRCSVM